ncbi:MAG: ParB/RepB/Spo0J family partition protein [Pseudomonadota bacterium]
MAAAAKKQKRGGLGRGLDALLGDAPASQTADFDAASDDAEPTPPSASVSALAEKRVDGGAPKLPIEYLSPDPDQPRRLFNEDALSELAASIAARGVLQPILVRPKGPDHYEIVAGERRWRAAQKARLHEVPVIIRKLTDEQAAEIALIENVQRVDLNPVEEAQAYQRLADHHGRTQEQIAKAVGKSRSHIANIMRLLSLPEQSLDALRGGDITMGHARALLATPDPDAALARVKKEGLSVRDTEKLAQRPAAKKTDANDVAASNGSAVKSKPKDADTRSLENDLAAALGLEVSIDHSKKGSGVVSINYLTLDQLDDVCRRLMGTSV